MKKIDIMKICTEKPEPRDFVLPGLPAGKLGALISPGGVGKSFWSLQAAVAVAAGKEADLLGISPSATGRVVIFSNEDDQTEIHQRMYAICKHFDKDIRYAIAENLDIYECEHTNIIDDKDFSEIKKIITGARLVFFDTIRNFHTLNENSTEDMTRLINRLKKLVKETDATIVYLHHTNKLAALNEVGDKQQAVRGSSVLVDNVRWQAYLQKMSIDESMKLSDRVDRQPIGVEMRSYYVKFGIAKMNHSQPLAERWYQRHEGGVLKPVILYPAKKKKDEKITIDDDIYVPSGSEQENTDKTDRAKIISELIKHRGRPRRVA